MMRWQDQGHEPAEDGEHTVATEKIRPTLPITPATSQATRAVHEMNQVIDVMTTGGGRSQAKPLDGGTPELTAILARLALIAGDLERATGLAGNRLDDLNQKGLIRPNRTDDPASITDAIAVIRAGQEQAKTLTATLTTAKDQLYELRGGFVPDTEASTPS